MAQQDEAAQRPSSEIFQIMRREESLAVRVAREVERLIVQGHLVAGTRLPSERDLAEQFGVSRTVVREAVRTLAARGLLEVRTGSGTVVRHPTSEAAAESMSRLLATHSHGLDYDRVIEVRRVLEVEIAGLAAERRTDDDLATLDTILAQAEDRRGDPHTFVETDVSFHEALARATHNDLFLVILSSIALAMIDVRRLGLRVPGTPERALTYHRSIFAAVKQGDGAAARHAMSEHMEEARQTVMAALAQDDGDGGAGPR